MSVLLGCGSSSSSADGGTPDLASVGGTSGVAGTAAGGHGGNAGNGGTTAVPQGGAAGEATAGAGALGGMATGAGGAAGSTSPPTGHGGAGAVSAMELCRTFCDRIATCDVSRDQQTCLNACTNSNAALYPKLRSDVVASVAACVAQKDCASLSLDTSLKACAVEAAAAIAPSAAATAFCAAADTAQAQCGVTIDKADCLISVKIYSDAAIADAMACTTKSCSLIYACTNATLNAAVGPWSLGGGVKPGKKCAGVANSCSYFSSSGQMAACMSAGCSYAQSCGGTASCFYGSTMTTCQAIAGCTWSGTSCTGTPTALCSAQAVASCAQLGGCYTVATCTGTVPLCSTLGVSACPAHPGCTIQDAM